MAINQKKILESTFGVSLVSFLGQALPLRLGHWLADTIAERIAARQDSEMIRAVRANQWVVCGESLEKEALDRAVSETLRYSARSLFDLYHYINRPEVTRHLIVLDEATRQLTRRSEFDERGLLVAGVHLSNFDLILQWLCTNGIRPLVLTIPDPQGGRRKEYEMRKKTGMNLVPASVSALRQALNHLEQGGIVLTGIDRPIPAPRVRPLFFGRPASLPMHHIFLALKVRVPMVVMAANLRPDGKYQIETSNSIEMDPHPDRDLEAIQNAEKVLSIAERFIRLVPQQWSMSLPVWPETLDLVPK